MGLNISVCIHGGRRRSHLVRNTVSVVEPPEWSDDERSGSFARHFVQRMSEICTPTTVDRAGMHSVNVNSDNRLSKQASLSRRMSSLTPPIQGVRGPPYSSLLVSDCARSDSRHSTARCLKADPKALCLPD